MCVNINETKMNVRKTKFSPRNVLKYKTDKLLVQYKALFIYLREMFPVSITNYSATYFCGCSNRNSPTGGFANGIPR